MKLIKNIISISLTALLLTQVASSLAADDKRERHQQRLEHMKQELSLTDEQVANIKKLYQDNKGQEKTRENREAMRAKIDTLLTPEQREKAKEMDVQHKAEKGTRKSAKE